MANNMKAEQSVEILRCFGGGYQLEIDGEPMGIFETARAAQDFAAASLLAIASHEHHADDTRIVGLAWGTRTIATCACGAYRTFDVPRGDSPADLNDHSWSPWRRLESERAS